MHKVAVGILGASGYVGRELCGLLAAHPRFELGFATANEQRGQRVRCGATDVTFAAAEDVSLGDAELVFSALPHGASRPWVEAARAAGARVVDLSSDFRPGNGANGVPYGLTEIARDRIAGADLVANPGCYPTAILLALAPLLARALVPGGYIIATAASGVTGAGYAARQDLMFAEVAGDFRAYAPGNDHRHLPEMRSMISESGSAAQIVFTPHLLPVARGILATVVVPVVELIGSPLSIWRDFYAGEPFIEVVDESPRLVDVVNRNVARLSAFPVSGIEQPALVVLAAIDNLLKGAAGQALQNANLMFGFAETMGLPA